MRGNLFPGINGTGGFLCYKINKRLGHMLLEGNNEIQAPEDIIPPGH